MVTHSSSKFGSEDSPQTNASNPVGSDHMQVNLNPPMQDNSYDDTSQSTENNGDIVPKTPPILDQDVTCPYGNAGNAGNTEDADSKDDISIDNYHHVVPGGDMAEKLSVVYKVQIFAKLAIEKSRGRPDTNYNRLLIETKNIDNELTKEGWVILFLAAGTIMLVTGGTAAMYYAGGAPIVSWASANSSSAAGFVSLCAGAVSGCGWVKASSDFRRKDIKSYSIKQLLDDLDSLMLGDPKYLKLCEELDIFARIKKYYEGSIETEIRLINQAFVGNIENNKLKNDIFEYFFDNNNSFQDYCSEEASKSYQRLGTTELEGIEAIKTIINKLKRNSLSLSQSDDNNWKDYLTDPFDKLLFLAFVRDQILTELGLSKEKEQPTTTLWSKVTCSSKAALGYRQEDTCVIV